MRWALCTRADTIWHMTVFLGTAKMLQEEKSHWSGTVVMIAQPAEETVGGAAAMLRAGLYQKFPKPDYVVALHDHYAIAAGKVAWREGPMLAGADAVDITIRGLEGMARRRRQRKIRS